MPDSGKGNPIIVQLEDQETRKKPKPEEANRSDYDGVFGRIVFLMCSFQTYLVTNQDKITNPRRNKTILAVIITLANIIGISMIIIGVGSLLSRKEKFDKLAKFATKSMYSATLLVVIGIFYVISCLFGYIGVFEKREIFSKWFMMISITFGFALFLTYIIWLTISNALEPDQVQREGKLVKLNKPPTKDIYFMSLVLVSAILHTVCGILTFLVLYRYRTLRGYTTLDEDEPDIAIFIKNLRDESERLKRTF